MKTTIRLQPIRTLIAYAVLGGFLSAATLLQAQPSAHYVPGVEGLKAATLPPPGFYLRDYNVFYYADRVNDQDGDEIGGLDPEAFIYANVPRLLWITDYKVLGGFIGVDALLPLQYTDLQIGGLDESTFGVGDLFGEVTWSTHMSHLDLAVGYGIWAPTGDSSTTDPTRAGAGFWTHMFTAGATWYPDAEKQWSVSALNRYEISTEKDDSNFTPGDTWTLEGGLSYALAKTVDIGVAGYYQRQVSTDDNGANSFQSSVAAVGPEISVFYPRVTFGWSLRYLYEFMSEDRMQGHTAVLTLTKRF